MNIDFTLVELIHKYHVDEFFPGFYPYYQAINIVKKWYLKLGKAVIISTKQADIDWFKAEICGKDIKSFLFRDSGIEWEIQDYMKQEYTFILVSFYGRDEVMVQLLESGCHIVCLYDVLERNNLVFNGNFYDIYREEYIKNNSGERGLDYGNFDISRIFFYHRRRYELETDKEIKKIMLKKLIFDCVYAKDFLTLKKYIDIMITYDEREEAERFRLFYEEVENLLLQIREALANRKKRDCIMLWLDRLEYGDDADMPFLRGLNDSSLVFSNAYTVTEYTEATFKSLFAKLRRVDDDSDKIIRVGTQNSAFFNDLRQRNYKFLYYGPRDVAEQEYTAEIYCQIAHSFTEIYWKAIGDILMDHSGKSFFCVLHEFVHTHPPYTSIGISGKQYCNRVSGVEYEPDEKLMDLQNVESRKYVDKQLEFFGELLPKEMFKIYMSDHGHSSFGKWHCILKIQQKAISPQICRNLISWYDFDELVFSLLDNTSVYEVGKKNTFCTIQDVEYYSNRWLSEKIERKNLETSPTFLPGYQGVITREDMFIRYNNGVEIYQKMQNDECMVTDDRLDYLRSITGKKKVDIVAGGKFKYSYLAYKITERCVARTREKQEKKQSIIRSVFEQCCEGEKLALRGGGIHSLWMLMELDEQLRKKVSCIIDRDRECYAGKMGVRVITLDEACKCDLDKVIISSYVYRKEWKAECQQNLKAKVIDIYELFEQQDIFCQEEYYKLEYDDQDYEGIVLE